MKATMLELLNENYDWEWFKVYKAKKTPTRAIREYLNDHDKNVKAKIVKSGTERDGVMYYCDEGEVRAYQIEIEN